MLKSYKEKNKINKESFQNDCINLCRKLDSLIDSSIKNINSDDDYKYTVVESTLAALWIQRTIQCFGVHSNGIEKMIKHNNKTMRDLVKDLKERGFE